MEANKIAYGAKGITLYNGVELTYCELGEENKEVLVTGAFYFHTVMPLMELLAKRYHVYGVVMRFDGKTDELCSDGSTNWARQWGADIYRFAKKMNLDRFRYFGKCHGTNPGWYLVKETLLNLDVPVGYMFANEDPVFNDYYESNIWDIMNTRRARTIILNGEKHLMELDSPERVANETFKFFDEACIDYFDEDIDDSVEIAEAAASEIPDEGFEGNWIISFKGPMGEQKMKLEIILEGSAVSGTINILGKNQKIIEGIATKAAFDFKVAVKIAIKKGTARIRGTREGDSISGIITLPVGDVEFTGIRA